MYRFAVMNSSEPAFIDPTSVRNILPSGRSTGYVKLVLDGGHAVTVEGTTEKMNEILNQYRPHPVSSSSLMNEITATRTSAAHHAAQTEAIRESRADLAAAQRELRAAREAMRDAVSESESTVPPQL